jgi:hypothetical protein
MQRNLKTGNRNLPTTEYVTLEDPAKLKLLQDHALGISWKKLSDRKWCLHCEKEFEGRTARVWRDAAGEHWLECGTPGCDGSPIDWAEYPWWNPSDPLTKAWRKLERQPGETPEQNSLRVDLPKNRKRN